MEPFCGSKTLCLAEVGYPKSFTAKDDVDNVGAGRAAKGATLGKAKENASIFRHRINSPIYSNQAHFHHLDL